MWPQLQCFRVSDLLTAVPAQGWREGDNILIFFCLSQILEAVALTEATNFQCSWNINLFLESEIRTWK